jgi:hypothetical protein
VTRRDLLRWGCLGTVAVWARRARAFGDSSKITFGQLRVEGKWDSRPHALRRLGFEIVDRTSLEVAPLPRPIDLASPDLFEYPFLALSVDGGFGALSERESSALRRFLVYGGFLLADSVDGGAAFDAAIRRELGRAVPEAALQRISGDHVLYKTFYLIDHQGGRQVVAPYLEGVTLGGRLVAVYSRNDLGGAWSRDDRGDWEFEVTPGGEEQRELAFRLGINLAMYATCLDYKDDQVHLPFILKRRR